MSKDKSWLEKIGEMFFPNDALIPEKVKVKSKPRPKTKIKRALKKLQKKAEKRKRHRQAEIDDWN